MNNFAALMPGTRQIMATGIASLTDARYFSAMGVDWMGFDLRMEPRLSVEQMQAIIDWVEGPQWLVEMESHAEVTLPADIDRIIMAPFELSNLQSNEHILRVRLRDLQAHQSARTPVLIDCDQTTPTITQQALIARLAQQTSVWIRAPWTPALLVDMLAVHPSLGIAMTAGREVEVGVKDYTPFDDLFELLGD